ncbi:MAG TPA: zinc-ribbon domain containing protein [Ktedonobacteraceae bacterium]|nr:zinc-ribbon domain containing protein [Ktedonobacteraceae bacterium]
MMSNEGYSDRILTCRDCGQEFTFTAGEQEFYASRNLTNDPSRCPACRAARRSGGGQSSSRSRTNTGEYYETTCADCGRPTSVPFIPREDRPVYCSDCFQAHRAPRTARSDSRGGYSSSGGSSYGGGRSGGRDRGGRNDRGGRDRW